MDKKQVHFNKTPQQILRDRRQREAGEYPSPAQRRIQSPVRIPPLDADFIEGGGTMNDQAKIMQDASSPLSSNYDPNTQNVFVTENEMKDPGFIRGVGQNIRANQPNLGKSYKPPLSQKSMDHMIALKEFQEMAEKEHDITENVEDRERVRIMANLGRDVEETKSSNIESGDAYKDIEDLLEEPIFKVLTSKARRKSIEANLSPLDVMDIVIHGEIRQEVSINSKVRAVYRSVSAREDLMVKQLMYGEKGSDRYLLDKYLFMQLTLALVSINGEPLPDHLDKSKMFSEELFLKKYEAIIAYPIQFLADLGVQYVWFDERVRGLFMEGSEVLKNS